MEILVVDGQGGGVGRALVERIRRDLPEAEIIAVGTNAAATAAMLRAGASSAATGENSVRVCAARAQVIAGPIGIVLKDAMLGEITGAMAMAIGESEAFKVLIPVQRCHAFVAGAQDQPLQYLLEDAARAVVECVRRNNMSLKGDK